MFNQDFDDIISSHPRERNPFYPKSETVYNYRKVLRCLLWAFLCGQFEWP